SRTSLVVKSGKNSTPTRGSRNIEGVTLVPATGLEPYDLLRHDHLMLSREAAAKISRALSATKPEMPIQIEPAPRPKKEPAGKTEHKPAAKAEAAPKAAKKPAAAKKEKPKAKPKVKKE